MWWLTASEKTLAIVVSIPFLYLIGLGIGRTFKQRAGVRLGVMFQLFCIAVAIYIPLSFLKLNVRYGPFDLSRDLGAALALLGAVAAVPLISRYFWDFYFERRRKTPIPKFLRDLAALVIFLTVALVVLSVDYGQTVPGLLAGSGIAAVILGFAMQDLLGNIISGIALEIGKPFKPGDWLLFENTHAEVIEVNWRSTRLRTNDDVCLDIPNNQIVRHTITNLSYPTGIHAMRISVGIDYQVAPNHVKDIICRAARDAAGVLQTPEPKTFLKAFGDSAIVYELMFWMERDEDYNEIFDSVHTNIWYALHRNGIKIPFPMRTLQIEPRKSAAKAHETRRTSLHASLKQQPLFKCLGEEAIAKLLAEGEYLRYGRAEKLIEQGMDGDSLFLLIHGSAGVYVARDGNDSTLVARLKAGDCVGEMSLLTGEKRSATVIAETDCEVLEIRKALFAEILQGNEKILANLSDLLAERRLATEGALASAGEKMELVSKQREYSANFLGRLYSFFEL